MFRWFEQRKVYIPSRVVPPEVRSQISNGQLQLEDVYFTTRDGFRLHGWFFPRSQSSKADRNRLLLMVFHGNKGNICHRIDFCRTWFELGVNILLFDYRGYGRSEGRPSEEGTYLDGQAAYAWARERGFAADSIIALGKSLGGGIASELAVREAVAGLILQNTFSNLPNVGSELFWWLPVRRFHSIKYDTLGKLPRIKVPVLILHSRKDQVIGFHHAEQNFAAANEPKMFREILGNHTGTLESGRAEYLAALQEYLTRFFPPVITTEAPEHREATTS